MTTTKKISEYNLSHRFLQAILNCKEKVGLLKIWELLIESGRVGDNKKNIYPKTHQVIYLIFLHFSRIFNTHFLSQTMTLRHVAIYMTTVDHAEVC